MRRFDWRKFKKKGLKKILSKDEKMLEENVQELKVEKGGNIKELSKEILPDE
ncbi:MAG: hypothetical protein NZ872_03690 [Archaeoglobaceae archaeon]|nr:hypothetical protein [Archaeoglobaceae archaeon]MDW8128302.1 hypothetical protein [Archaeoglobaceae archaeon]